MKSVRVEVKKADHALDLPLPAYMSDAASGMDLLAAVETTVLPGERAHVPTGVHLAIPAGFEAQIRPRSGLALNHGVTLLNSPGTVDADYRGEVGIVLINLGKEPFTVSRGDRIAQMVIAPVCKAKLAETDTLPGSDRGKGGFGHTGL